MAVSAAPNPAGDLKQSPTGGAETPPDRLENAVAIIERHSVWVLGTLMLLSGALILYMGRGLSFYYDEWEWLIHDSAGGVHWLLLAHVGNISVFPAAIYRLLFHVVGLDHYMVFRLDVIVLHLVCGALIYLMAARRIPRLPALLASALILFLGSAWEDLLWGFQVGYLLSAAGGLATWVLLEQRRRFSDLAAMLCLVVSAGSSSLGIAIMIGVAVELAKERSRLWIVIVPVLLYGLWYLGYGVSQVTEASLIHAPGFAADMAGAAFGGLAGHDLEWGRPMALLGLLIVLRHLFGDIKISARLTGLLATGLALWAITAAARSTISPPDSSRYIYLGAIVIVLIGVELLRGVAITPRASAVSALIVAFCGVSGLTLLHSGSVGWRATSHTVTAELGALELAARYAPATYRPDPIYAPPVMAGEYLQAVKRIGSTPADSPAEIQTAESSARTSADSVLFALETPKLVQIPHNHASSSSSPLQVIELTAASQQRRGGCIELAAPPASAATAIVVVPRDGVLISDHGNYHMLLSVKRFGEGFLALDHSVPAQTEMSLSIPADSSSVGWQLQLTSRSSFSVCGES